MTVDAVHPKDLPREYYDFGRYVSFDRFQTYWFQIQEVLALQPRDVLEIGIGSGVVKEAVKSAGARVTTVDINASLKPDIVAPLNKLGEVISENSFDVVLCSRVFHHIPLAEVPHALDQLLHVSRRYVVLVLAVDDFRFYLSGRATGMRSRHFTLPLPGALKRLLVRMAGKEQESYYTNWRIGSSRQTDRRAIDAMISSKCTIVKEYSVPPDHGHRLYLLQKHSAAETGPASRSDAA